MKKHGRIVAWAAASILAGFALAGEKADADRAKITAHFADPDSHWTWVFSGDSITHGAVHLKGWRSYPEIFTERVRTELYRNLDAVVNVGNSGHSTAQLLDAAQYERQIRRHRPDVVFVMIGMNDPARGIAPEQYKSNLIELVRRLRADGAIPILQTSNTIQRIAHPDTPYLQGYVLRYEQLPAYMEQVRAVAREEDVILIDHFAHWSSAAADPDVLDDWLAEAIHPGAKGHQQFAILIFKELGILLPHSECATGPVGLPAAVAGEGLRGYADAFDAVDAWPILYRAADGPPAGDWVSGYPVGKLSAFEEDGVSYLRVDNTSTGADEGPIVRFGRPEALGDPRRVVLLETRMRFPEQMAPSEKPYRFYLGVGAGAGDQAVDALLVISGNEIAGTLGTLKSPRIGNGFFRLRMACSPSRGQAALWIDDHYLGTFPLRRVTADGARLLWGDASSGVGGVAELEYIKAAPVPER